MAAAATMAAFEEPKSINLVFLDDKQTQQSCALSSQGRGPDDLEDTVSDGELAVPALQRWNRPRGNIARFAASFYSMFVFGLSDAAYGALLPYVRRLPSLSEALTR